MGIAKNNWRIVCDASTANKICPCKQDNKPLDDDDDVPVIFENLKCRSRPFQLPFLASRQRRTHKAVVCASRARRRGAVAVQRACKSGGGTASLCTKNQLVVFCRRVAAAVCAVREDCRAHEVGCDDLRLLRGGHVYSIEQ